jgi:hypothetical protein
MPVRGALDVLPFARSNSRSHRWSPFGAFGYLLIERGAALEDRRHARALAYRISQAEFKETMQMMRDEYEAHDLFRTHLERSIPHAHVAVLSRNNSANRLTAATSLPDGSPLERSLRELGWLIEVKPVAGPSS